MIPGLCPESLAREMLRSLPGITEEPSLGKDGDGGGHHGDAVARKTGRRLERRQENVAAVFFGFRPPGSSGMTSLQGR